MPIVIAKPELESRKLRPKLPAEVWLEIEDYCKAFKIREIEDFFCQVAQHALKTDKDWIKINKQKLEEKNL